MFLASLLLKRFFDIVEEDTMMITPAMIKKSPTAVCKHDWYSQY